jgi:radical SAM/Cys-rich protein
MAQLTLQRRNDPLADPARQVRLLEAGPQRPFDAMLADSGLFPLRATGIAVLQVNVGKLCNQTCRHCHVDAGPDRREVMDGATVDHCLGVLEKTEIPTLDVTGGAPELNPHFRRMIAAARGLGRRVLDRCNLTILLAPGFDDLPMFLADHRVEIVASLPCYSPQNVEAQRGEGVFEKSIAALRRLNAVGYGRPESGLVLNLVYNPIGPSLPPAQDKLEADYRDQLGSLYDVRFNRLYTIANMPIGRFLDDLLQSGRYEAYMLQLVEAYNPAAAAGVMCRTTLSVGWDGRLSDCDFNQMLDLGVGPGAPGHIRDFNAALLENRRIVTGRHCYGCTAGAGSSCQGATVA